MPVKICVGADNAGQEGKATISQLLLAAGHELVDGGVKDEEPVDFPDVALAVCWRVKNGDAERGVLVCGTGVGACMAANRVAGIRAAVAHDIYSAHQAVEHDDANVLCLGAKIVGPWLMGDLVMAFLSARFQGTKEFRRRLEKLARMETGHDKP